MSRTLVILLAVLASPANADEIKGPYYWGWSRPADAPGPNILNDSSAVFAVEGQAYELYATTSPTAGVREVLEAAIASLAPGLRIDCFNRKTSGSWTELPAAGLGDPRAAIPPAWKPSGIELSYYLPPASDCAGAIVADALPATFAASFEHPSGNRLRLSASPRQGETATQPGLVTDEYSTWTSARFYFSVSTGGPGLGEGVVVAVSRALDPEFDAACQRRKKRLDDAQAAAHGFRSPRVPAGYAKIAEQRTAEVSPGGCTQGPRDLGKFALDWAFRSAAGVLLEAGAQRDPAVPPEPAQPLVGDGYVRWTDEQGTRYFVYARSEVDGPGMPMEEVLLVARSLDPQLTLPEGGAR
jgi:hypothetical protein